MKVEKKVSLGGRFAIAKEDIFEGDLITILNEGETVEGQYGERLVFKIRTKNGEDDLILTFNQTTINYLIDAYGEDTEKWVGEDVKAWIVKSNIKGKMRNVIYLTHKDWIETEDGYAPASGNAEEKIPELDTSNDIASVEEKDIPFGK